MKRCAEIEPLIALSAGGELDEKIGREVLSHAAQCPGCHRQMAELKKLISTGREMFAAEYELGEPVLARIAREASERAAAGAWWRRWSLLNYLPTPSRQSLATVAVMGLLAAVVVLPPVLRDGLEPDRSGAAAKVERLEMAVQEGKVLLAWQNGGPGSSHTVRKSSDPRGLGSAEAHTVQGTFWVDEDPNSSPIVFYRID